MLDVVQQVVAGAPAPASHLYLDWTFWQGLVALLALILSQLPPLVTFLRPRRLRLDVPTKINITHKVGNPNVTFLMSLRNLGGREVRVRSIYLTITRGKSAPFRIDAQQFESPNVTPWLLFVPFALRPGELWTRNVGFYNELDRQTDKGFRANRLAMQHRIRELIAERPKDKEKEVVHVEEPLVAPFKQLFEKQFVWLPGEYLMEIVVVTEPERATLHKKYRFTLFESDTSELKEHVDEFSMGGAGITFTGEHTTFIWAPISEESE